jgi:trk system potassium uptake protein TrkH
MKLKLSHTQIIALGFLLLIAVGTGLLSLPAATADGARAPLLTTLFTAVSASCVTGLVLQDTATYWSTFGKVVIIALIQIGGLGVITISTLFFLLLRRRVGLRQREVLTESINTTAVGDILRLFRLILLGTAVMELAGALALSIRFIPRFGPGRGVAYALFHAVSAFCNAGFDLMGVLEPYSSFTAFSGDWLVNLTLIALIVIGGLGFLVWDDLLKNGLHVRRWCFQTRLVLSVSGVLLLGGTLLIWLMERQATAAGLPAGEQLLTSLFGAVTARTAGFNTVDTAAMSDGGKFVTILLMFVGGSPGSTAGGVKTTTVAVILVMAACSVTNRTAPSVLGRRIPDGVLHKAVSVVVINLGFALIGTLILCGGQRLPLTDVLFECFSAIGTVGMTTGITRDLNTLSTLTIAVLMYAGRVGSVSFAMALIERRARPAVMYPTENITIG